MKRKGNKNRPNQKLKHKVRKGKEPTYKFRYQMTRDGMKPIRNT